MKISNIIIVAVIIFVSSGFTKDCYKEWLKAYEKATNEYQQNLNHCDESGGLWRNLCYLETEERYSDALETAGDIYYNC